MSTLRYVHPRNGVGVYERSRQPTAVPRKTRIARPEPVLRSAPGAPEGVQALESAMFDVALHPRENAENSQVWQGAFVPSE